jgi:hypothetical protein
MAPWLANIFGLMRCASAGIFVAGTVLTNGLKGHDYVIVLLWTVVGTTWYVEYVTGVWRDPFVL